MRYTSVMRSSHRFLLPLLLATTLVACGKGQQQEALKGLPPMSKNCEWLQDRFDTFVGQPAYCSTFTAQNMDAQPYFGGAQLQSVNKTVSAQKGYFQYDLVFHTRTSTVTVSTLSTANIDFAAGKFYAVDLLNTCRFQALQQTPVAPASLLQSFSLPNKLTCI
jgi:hypothetical protein